MSTAPGSLVYYVSGNRRLNEDGEKRRLASGESYETCDSLMIDDVGACSSSNAAADCVQCGVETEMVVQDPHRGVCGCGPLQDAGKAVLCQV